MREKIRSLERFLFCSFAGVGSALYTTSCCLREFDYVNDGYFYGDRGLRYGVASLVGLTTALGFFTLYGLIYLNKKISEERK